MESYKKLPSGRANVTARNNANRNNANANSINAYSTTGQTGLPYHINSTKHNRKRSLKNNNGNVYASFRRLKLTHPERLTRYFENQRERHARNNAESAESEELVLSHFKKALAPIDAALAARKTRKSKKSKNSNTNTYDTRHLGFAEESGRLYGKIVEWCKGKTKKQIDAEFERLEENPGLLNAHLSVKEKELIRDRVVREMFKELYDMGYLI